MEKNTESRTDVTDDSLRLAMQFALAVMASHDGGRLHLAATPESYLATPALASATQQNQSLLPLAMLPPELADFEEFNLCCDLHEAARQFAAARISMDPRRIDLFNLGRLYCQIFTHATTDEYLRGPSIKARAPKQLHIIIDGCLGYSPEQRYVSCDPLVAAIEACNVDLSTTASTVGPSNAGRGTTNPPTEAGTRPQPALPFQQLGQYEVLQPLGGGGMGDVYRAFDPTLDRFVAIKVLPPALSRDAEFVERFSREARAIAKLSHPNLVSVHSIGTDNSLYYFAMQYVEGPSLAEVLQQQRVFGPAESVEIATQVLDGLAEAHRHGMIHRDIKPGNILIDSARQKVMLADFGLVKSMGTDGHTSAGMIVGTASYVSPEQGQGKDVDQRSDLYSIGVLLYQLLSGRLPFAADNATAIVFQHVYEDPPSLLQVAPAVPEPLAAIVHRLLEKKTAAAIPVS